MSMLEQVYKPIILLDLTSEWLSEEAKNELMKSMEEMAKEVGGVYLIAQ